MTIRTAKYKNSTNRKRKRRETFAETQKKRWKRSKSEERTELKNAVGNILHVNRKC